MYKKWSDAPVCWLCDYGWMLLLALALLLTGWFARGYWLPILGVTPTSTPAPTITPASATVTPTLDLYGYTNASGGYAFNYPTTWQGLESETDAHFLLPDDAKVQITIRTALLEDTLQTIVADAGPWLLPQSKISDATVGGEAALKEDFLNAENVVTGRAYHVIHNGKIYFIALFSSPELPLPPSFPETLTQFDQVVSSFYFIQP